jgi:hypothetical protein
MSTRKRFGALAAATALVTTALGLAAPAPATAAPVAFDNGQTITDTAGNLMHAHGGGMLKVGNTYYLVGEQRNDYLFDQVSMYSSTDLVNWTFENDILSAESHPDLSPSNIERPKVIYNASTGKYVLWAHKENGVDYGDAEVAVAVSDTVDGDYAYQGSFRPAGYDSRDMTLFVDSDGTGYLISAADVNYDLNVYRLTPDYLAIDELVHVFDGYHREAPPSSSATASTSSSPPARPAGTPTRPSTPPPRTSPKAPGPAGPTPGTPPPTAPSRPSSPPCRARPGPATSTWATAGARNGAANPWTASTCGCPSASRATPA